jgi:phosphate transport system substrate-binding protein
MKKIVGILLAAAAFAAQAQITGAGATFPAPIYSKWAAAYNKETGTTVNYNPIGSGGGVAQIIAKTVDFGASDDPTPDTKLKEVGLYQFPSVIGGVVAVINIKGIEPGKMILDGKTLADIYQGKISKWNDAAITKLNPSLALPDAAINVVVRADGSGTTAVFTDYLSKVNPEFKAGTGTGKTVTWKPVNLSAGKGNAGVAANVQQLAGSIGYVEYAFAKQSKLTHVAMKNRKGVVVQPDDLTFAESAKTADWSTPNMAVNLNDLDGWPITAATFILIYPAGEKTKQVTKFFDWVYTKGDKDATDLDYVPLPQKVKDQVRADWAKLVK